MVQIKPIISNRDLSGYMRAPFDPEDTDTDIHNDNTDSKWRECYYKANSIVENTQEKHIQKKNIQDC